MREQVPCCTCKQLFVGKGKDKGVSCEVCEEWYHSTCEGVAAEVFKLLKKDTPGLHWFCQGCERGVAKLHFAISAVQAKVSQMEERIEKIEEKLKSWNVWETAIIPLYLQLSWNLVCGVDNQNSMKPVRQVKL